MRCVYKWAKWAEMYHLEGENGPTELYSIWIKMKSTFSFMKFKGGKTEKRPDLLCKMSLSSHECWRLLRMVKGIWIWIRTDHNLNTKSKISRWQSYASTNQILPRIQINNNLKVMIIFLWVNDAQNPKAAYKHSKFSRSMREMLPPGGWLQ